MRTTLTTIFLIFTLHLAYSQIATPGTPPSFTKNMTKIVEKHTLPSFDAAAMLAEDELTKGEGPLRFGKRHKVNIHPKNAGTWENLPNGDRIWRITFTSPDAHSLNFLFSQFHLPAGAKMYAYNTDRTEVRGAFTARNNKSDGKFAITPIQGETVTLEYVEPAVVKGQALINLSYVVHAYRNLHTTMEEILAKGYGDSGSCNNDVACPESAGWEDQIRSVGLVIDSGFRACTGAMVNNVNQDGTPYFLSADHCGVAIDGNWSFVFNYDSPTCGGPDGDLSQSVVGGVLRANSAASDFALFEMSLPPPSDYVVYYAGWSKLETPALNCTAIHHPAGDVKKISFNDDPLFSGAWGNGGDNIPGGNHWIVSEWEDGTTEGGSSGSPIFDQNKLIIGQLHGGGASCTNVTYDSYGKLDVSWEGGGTPNTRLVDWLGAGRDTLHGAYFIEPPLAVDMQAVNLAGVDGVSCNGVTTPTILVRNIGSTEITSFTVEYDYDGNTSQTYEWTGDAIGFYESTIIELPTETLSIGTHTFTASIVMPNGIMDEDASNNSSSSSFDVIEGNTLTINILADDYPGETTYEITNQDTGEVTYTGAGFVANTLNIDDYCLQDGCYIFTIYDAYSDGICCGFGEGNYEIVNENGDVITSGGEFDASESFGFCVPFVLTANFEVADQVCKSTPFTIQNSSQLATTYNWTAPGSNEASSTAANPTFTYDTPGTYTITLVAGNDSESDTYSQDIEVTDGNGLIIRLTTDNYPAETTYEIRDDAGSLLYSAGDFTGQGQLFEDDYCLADGCYVFTIFDSADDGICCGFGEGDFSLVDVNGAVIDTGGEFTSEMSVEFCLPFTSPPASAAFEVDDTYCVGNEVVVTNNSQNATTYAWSAIGAENPTSTEENPVFTYDTSGEYTIELTASNASGSSTTSSTITVLDNPVITTVTGNATPVNGSTETYTTPNTMGSAYTWSIVGGTQVAGGTTNTIDVLWNDMNNSAYLCVSELNAAGCESEEFCYDVQTVVGVNEVELAQNLQLFPNPTTGKIFIESNTNPTEVEVFDVVGQQVEVTWNANQIDLSQQAIGVYLLRLTFEEGTVTKRIILK